MHSGVGSAGGHVVFSVAFEVNSFSRAFVPFDCGYPTRSAIVLSYLSTHLPQAHLHFVLLMSLKNHWLRLKTIEEIQIRTVIRHERNLSEYSNIYLKKSHQKPVRTS